MFNDSTIPSIWLQLRLHNSIRTFELVPDNERAIVVGSLLRADIRIDEPGIAPVHFHFERDGYLVYLVPAYGAELRVDGERVHGPHPIRRQGLVEFAAHRMHVLVLEHPPRFVEQEFFATPADDSTPETPAEYGDRTTIAVRPYEPMTQPYDGPPQPSEVVSPALLQHVLAPRTARPDVRSADDASRGATSSTSTSSIAVASRRRRFVRPLLVVVMSLFVLAILVLAARRGSPHPSTAAPDAAPPRGDHSFGEDGTDDRAGGRVLLEPAVESDGAP